MAVQAQPIQPQPQHAAPLAPHGNDVLEEVEPGFWQEPWVQNSLPIVASLLIHVGLILIGMLTNTANKAATTVTQEQVIVPDAAIVAGDVGGIPNPGLGGDPNRPAASDLVPENARTEGWNKQPSKSLQAVVAGGSGDTATDTMIGIGAGQSLGNGKGSTNGTGAGDGASAPFGVPGGGKGTGPRSPFMGVSGNSRTVAYVCDASGSMMGMPFDLVKIELKKAVDVLVPTQAFNIIFFQEGKGEAASRRLMMANPDNKQRAYQFLDQVTVKASSDPIPSLRLAFSEKPQLLYLLTDGAFDDNDAVIAEIKKLNASKQTHVYTIAFFSPNSPESERKVCEDVLRSIANDNGGQFKVVLTADLMK